MVPTLFYVVVELSRFTRPPINKSWEVSERARKRGVNAFFFLLSCIYYEKQQLLYTEIAEKLIDLYSNVAM